MLNDMKTLYQAYLEILLKHFDVFIYFEVADILQGFLREWLICLVLTEPIQIKCGDLEWVWNSKSVVNGYQFFRFSTLLVGLFLNQNVACISIKVEKSQVENCNLVDLVSGEERIWEILDRPHAWDERLERSKSSLIGATLGIVANRGWVCCTGG